MAEPRESAVATRSSLLPDVDPWRGLDPFRSVFDRFFQDVPESWRQLQTFTTPQVDITETADEYRVHAELPGVSKDDVTVELEHGTLTIRGEKKSQRDEKNEKGRRLECSYGAFSRSFSPARRRGPGPDRGEVQGRSARRDGQTIGGEQAEAGRDQGLKGQTHEDPDRTDSHGFDRGRACEAGLPREAQPTRPT